MTASVALFIALTYPAGLAESARTGKPLVTFVGQPAYNVPGSVVCRVDRLPGRPAVCVVVSRPQPDGTHVQTRLISGRPGPVTLAATKPPARASGPPLAPKAAAGLHTHRCGVCGATWSHGHDSFGKVADHTCPVCGAGPWWNPVSSAAPPSVSQRVAAMQFNLPAFQAGGCPGGVCPTGVQPARRGWFR